MKIICVGRNYKKHIEELNSEIDEEPLIFLKPDSAILAKREPFFIPGFSSNIHYEVEILVKISRLGKCIDPQFAYKYYDEIGLGVDFTARDLQKKLKEKGLPWEKSKAFDRSAVIGKFISKDKFTDISDINFYLKKNKTIVQKGNTFEMILGIDSLIVYVSRFFTLKIGDIIFTGTPSGVGRVEEDDVLEGFIEQERCFSVNVK